MAGSSAVKLNGRRLRELLRARFPGGIRDFQALWNADGGIDRTVFNRWTRGQLPKDMDRMLRLCALLDADPFSLLVPDAEDGGQFIEQLTVAHLTGYWVPALRFVASFVGRRHDWPPTGIARAHFAREWIVHDHALAAPDDAPPAAVMFEITVDPNRLATHPQAIHIALRHSAYYRRRWLQVATVVLDGSTACLMHITGRFERCLFTPGAGPLRVAIATGPEAEEAGLASLHPFDSRLSEPQASWAADLRFPS